MHAAHLVHLFAIAVAFSGLPAAAGEANEGALLSFKVSSSSVPEPGITNRSSLKGAVLVAFNEKFAMQSRPYRLELSAAEDSAAANVTVTLYDARSDSLVLVGTQQISVPAAGGNVAQMTGPDGTAYAVSVEFKRAKIPSSKS